MRPNLFANTPDILHAYLQRGGRPAFQVRLVLAATLGRHATASTAASSCPRTCRSRKAARSTSTRRSTRSGRATSSRPAAWRSSIGRINAIRRDASGAAARLGPRVPPDRQRRAHLLQQAIRRRPRPGAGRRQPRSVPDAARLRAAAARRTGASRPTRPSRSSTCCPASATSGAANGTTCGSIRRAASRTSCTCRCPTPCADRRTRPCPIRTIRCGTRTPSSTRRTSARSSTAPTTASATFPGLTQKLDYLQGLGINCLWLLPFYPSPLRDDGYDIADYENIHPSYGTLDDFDRFIDEAHRRGIRVITELVINHTSDQHPWFQAARRAPAGLAGARLLRVERHEPEVPGRADHLHRHRDVELELGRHGQGVLLAPVLPSSARPELRQPGGARGGDQGDAVLARPRRRRPAARRRAVPDRARRHDLREPAKRRTRC